MRKLSRQESRNRTALESARRGSGGLPMPYEHTAKPTTEECAEFRAREERMPAGYATGWERPSPDAAAKVYGLVRDFVPSLDAIHPDPVTACQLLTVALDVAVVSARYGHRIEERHGISDAQLLRRVQRRVMRNTLTDAIMRRWSPWARQARVAGRAFTVTQMTEATATSAWRDLLVQKINLPLLWKLIAHEHEIKHPLFRASLSRRWEDEGYDIKLNRGPALDAFELLVRNDPDYRHSRVRHSWRLWIEGDDPPPVDHHAPITAERIHNEVEATLGETSKKVRTIQESVVLLFNAPLFVKDYERVEAAQKRIRLMASAHLGMPWSTIASLALKNRANSPTTSRQAFSEANPEVRLFRARELKMRIWLQEFRSIYEQVLRERAPVRVRSEFYKILNRRWQNAHFFPMQTSTKKDAPLPEALSLQEYYDDLGETYTAADLQRDADHFWTMVSTPRSRWFAAPDGQRLVELDISSSQTQIQAVLLNLAGLEDLAITQRQPLKEWLARQAWTYRKGAVLDEPKAVVLAEVLKEIEKQWRKDVMAKRAHPDHGGDSETMRKLIDKREKARAKAIERKSAAMLAVDVHALPDLIVQSDERPDGYTGPDDPRLIEMMKMVWMLDGYGPLIQRIIRDVESDPDTYGPGWRRRDLEGEDRLLAELAGLPWKEQTIDVRGLTILLSTVPGFLARRAFMRDCKDAVLKLIAANGFTGITMTDPLDGEGATFTWNHPLSTPDRLSRTAGDDRWEITLVKPGSFRKQTPGKLGQYESPACPECYFGKGRLRGDRWYCSDWRNCGDEINDRWVPTNWKATFHPAARSAEGLLQVDDEKLKKAFTPMLVHKLDSLFSSHVMLKLHEAGVTTLGGVHDCWIVAENDLPKLEAAIKAAGEPWLLALRPVYTWLRANLPVPAVGGQPIEDAFTAWEDRIRRKDWPHFYAKGDPPPLGLSI